MTLTFCISCKQKEPKLIDSPVDLRNEQHADQTESKTSHVEKVIKSDNSKNRVYLQIIKENKIGKVHVHKSATDTTWRTFLGFLKVDTAGIRFGVISEFEKVKASSTWHGHSSVYLIDEKGNPKWRMIVPMPDELPIKLQGNSFCFYIDGKTACAVYKLVGGNLFCVDPTHCFEVVQE